MDRTQQPRTLMDAWTLTVDDAALAFGVEGAEITAWVRDGVPPDRDSVLTDLASATAILQAYVKPERIPQVVRRAASRLADRSLLDLARGGLHAEVLDAVRQMFDLQSSQP